MNLLNQQRQISEVDFGKKISRQGFLKLSGRAAAGTAMFLTVPGLMDLLEASPQNKTDQAKATDLFNHPAEMFSSPILNALNTGLTAPNPHNTQAWKFQVLNDHEAFLYVDENRILLETDPTTRQIHIGCGAFLSHLVLGAAKTGYETNLKLFPKGQYPLKQTGKKPVAHIQLIKNKQVKAPDWYKHIAGRATNRTPYYGPDITTKEHEDICNKAITNGSHAYLIKKQEAREQYFDLFKKAFLLELQTYDKDEESRRWFRLKTKDIYSKRDGITLEGNGLTGIRLWLARNLFFSLKPEIYHNAQSTKYAAEAFNQALDNSAGLVFLSSPGNTPIDWIYSGMDYANYQLELTARGMVMQPMSQVLQEYDEMKPFFDKFENLIKPLNPGKVQMIIRVGRSNYFFRSPRRELNDLIKKEL